jgi:hypothetical protein
MMLADTEAKDDYFAERYFDGDSQAFVEACQKSVLATQEYLRSVAGENFISTSFFNHFSEKRFCAIENGYIESLTRAYQTQRLPRVNSDIAARSGLYLVLYGYKRTSDKEFLKQRTIRTMAQYLTLGRLIGEDPQSLVIVHDTVNGPIFRKSNKYVNGYEDVQVARPPVIRKDLKVY